MSNPKTDSAINGSAMSKPLAKSKAKNISPALSDSEEEMPVQVKSKFRGFAALAGDMMDVSDDDTNSDDSDTKPTINHPSKQTKKNNIKYEVSDEDSNDSDKLNSSPERVKAVKKKAPKKEPPKKDLPKKDPPKKDKKKGKKAKQEVEEEDFDAILAEARAAAGATEPIVEPEVVEEEKVPDTKQKKTRRKKGKEIEEPVVTDGPDDAEVNNVDSLDAKAVSEAAEVRPASGTSSPEEEDDSVETRPKKDATKNKKKKEEDDEKKKKKNAPNKKLLAAMKELQQKQKEEEDARRQQEEELRRQEEERIRIEEENRRLEEERKERKKQKEKERKERLKAEGKLLTAKQKADQRRAQEMLEHLKAQGLVVGAADKKTPRLGSKSFAKKKSKAEEKQVAGSETADLVDTEPSAAVAEHLVESAVLKEEPEEEGGVKDSWDISSGEDNDDEQEAEEEEGQDDETEESSASTKLEVAKDEAVEESRTEEEVSESEDEGESDEEVKDDQMSQREKVIARLQKRRELNEKNRDIRVLRAPVICVLGHVDHGKTKILDKLRRTNVQEGEVGGITQQIGATNVPAEAIANQTKMVKPAFSIDQIDFPGLLIIDTPGHESFSNLRSRGSSLCDMAILVVDITQGLEPQTIESIELLKKRKTPFVVALNKVDRVFEWEGNQHKDIKEVVQAQAEFAKNDFERRVKEITIRLNEQGLNAALFYENPDPRTYVSLVPTSAITGDGMGNLIALICTMCQAKLAPQLRYSEELQCVVLEVKTIQGYGTTIDVILVNGRLREGDNIVLAGTEGPIVTQIRSLLMPKPLKEIRVKGSYDEFKEIKAAQGVKIAAKELDKAIAGLSLRVAQHEDEISVLKEVVHKDFTLAMKAIKVKDRGVYVQASTLGALEALLEFFKTKGIPYSGIRVGPVVKRDVMKAAAMLEHDDKYAVILAFDVKVDRDAQELHLYLL
ncbi:eukaryotic translation initiation factor 5B isoform X2 [Hyalella azteca]|uniref:Eukaryotic translation initiation factor 5B isoform X2 n=1 Tax=Hyalella azteca TaxID=294128 RepID=A0A8B7PEE0_HYAAZ|nr:eukaryotic translation initiation factor 5B isoform X2 [Hyalella azteca]